MKPREIVGYAIVSDDGMLADAAGVMPAALKFEADQRFFADGLDKVDAVVHGRHSHEQQPNSPRRRRLVVTRQVAALAPDPANDKALLWNPAGASLEEAWAALGVADGKLGVIGGTGVFGMFLPRYDAFHLTCAPGVKLPAGRPVFPGVPAQTPEQILKGCGYRAAGRRVLDAGKNLAVVTWKR